MADLRKLNLQFKSSMYKILFVKSQHLRQLLQFDKSGNTNQNDGINNTLLSCVGLVAKMVFIQINKHRLMLLLITC